MGINEIFLEIDKLPLDEKIKAINEIRKRLMKSAHLKMNLWIVCYGCQQIRLRPMIITPIKLHRLK